MSHIRFKSLWSKIVCLLIFFSILGDIQAQDLLSFIEQCKNCNGPVKQIKTTEKFENDYPRTTNTLDIYLEFNLQKQLTKREVFINNTISKTVHFFYVDSLLIYEHHIEPEEDDYFLIYQYLRKKLPAKIIKVNTKQEIIHFAKLEYTPDFEPVILSFYNLLDELKEKRRVEYIGNNYVLIQYLDSDHKKSKLVKHELLCKYNQPENLKKRDFNDIVTKPLKIDYKNNTITILKSVLIDSKTEQIQIEEVSYDDFGNWVSKKTFELRKKKTKKYLVREVNRTIEYY